MILVQTYTGHSGLVYGIDYVNADTVVTGSQDRTIKIWRISTGATSLTISPEKYVNGVAVLSDGISLAANCLYYILFFNINTGAFISASSSQSSSSDLIDLIVLSSTLFASSGTDKTVRIWSQINKQTQFTLSGHNATVFGIRLVASDILASASIDKTIKLWNITSGTLIRTLTGHTGSLMFSVDYYDCSIIASGSTGTEGIKLWNIFSGESLSISSGGLLIGALAVYNAASSK
jgi:WD40 repeat protein